VPVSRAFEDIEPLARGTGHGRGWLTNETWRWDVIRSTRFWMVLFVVMGVISFALTSAFGVEGSNNDPLIAEIGNGGMLLAVVGLLAAGVVQVVRSLRAPGEEAR
jgi:hypothetical protein